MENRIYLSRNDRFNFLDGDDSWVRYSNSNINKKWYTPITHRGSRRQAEFFGFSNDFISIKEFCELLAI
jgi:hypothetical protein